MNAKAATARRTVKTRSSETRAARRAVKSVATGTPQSAKTGLISAGIDSATAKRFAGAFSNGVTPTEIIEGAVKRKKNSRKTKTVPVKLYDRATFTARLAVYRPKDQGAAAVFERAAHRLAA